MGVQTEHVLSPRDKEQLGNMGKALREVAHYAPIVAVVAFACEKAALGEMSRSDLLAAHEVVRQGMDSVARVGGKDPILSAAVAARRALMFATGQGQKDFVTTNFESCMNDARLGLLHMPKP